MTKRGAEGLRSVRVWDLPTRLFHWLLVVSVALSLVSGRLGWMSLHFAAGYTILTLLLFRVIWGFVGSRSARFVDFLKGPRAVIEHLGHLRQPAKAVPPVLGHNALGGWMVFMLLTALMFQALSGLFTSDDIITDGPLVGVVSGATVSLFSTLHRLFDVLILALVVIHVTAVLAYLLLRRENLVRPMVTGRKTVPAGVQVEVPSLAGLRRAILALAAAAAVVVAVLQAA